MKLFVFVLLIITGCAHSKSGNDNNKEIQRLNKELEISKNENKKVCWKSMKKICQHEFKCVERGVKVCESFGNENK